MIISRLEWNKSGMNVNINAEKYNGKQKQKILNVVYIVTFVVTGLM